MKRLGRYSGQILAVGAVALFALSLITSGFGNSPRSCVRRCERYVRDRQEIAEVRVAKALEMSPESCLDIEDLPDDIVLYKYNSDTLHSWINRFPVSDDRSDAVPYGYRLNPIRDHSGGIAPLAYLRDEWQYALLGGEHYIVSKWHSSSGRTKIIAGIRLEFPADTPYAAAPLSEYSPDTVSGLDGRPLFAIVASEVGGGATLFLIILRWAAFLLAFASALVSHCGRRTWGSFLVATAALMLLRALAFPLESFSSERATLFSPALYADNVAFSSLGDFLLNNLFVGAVAVMLFAMREMIDSRLFTALRRKVAVISASVLALTVAAYIFMALRSIVLNSNIVLEPFRITGLSVYSFLCFLSLAVLLVSLMLVCQLAVLFSGRFPDFSLFDWKRMVPVTALFSIFVVLSVSGYGLKKEYDRNHLATSRLAIDRDMPMELHLLAMESPIASDSFIAALSAVGAGDLIRNRIFDRYIGAFIRDRYDVEIALPPAGERIPVEISEERVSPNFTFINNYDGKPSYRGVFHFFNPADRSFPTLLLTFKAKRMPDQFGAELLAGIGGPVYSFARYSDGHLAVNEGSYNYSSVLPPGFRDGYSTVSSSGFIHFVNHLSDDCVTVISRRHIPPFTYVVSFSYLFIFFGLFIVMVTSTLRKGMLFHLPRHSLKRKITLLMTGSMVIALATMAVSTILYTGRTAGQTIESQMGEKLNSVTKSLTDYCRNASSAGDLCTPEFVSAMELVSRISAVDVNVYSVDGSLLCSTDLRNAYRRIDHRAFHAIVHLASLRHFGTETGVDGQSLRTMYAPLFNSRGDMVAVVNIPWHPGVAKVEDSLSPTVSVIVNLYIVLLIAALFISLLLSNNILSPIVAVRQKMAGLASATGADTDKHLPAIDSADELGVLVRSYNSMVDALEESTRRLAQSEREQAWKEMARQIAHEIKNPLTPMRLSIQYLMRLKQSGVEGWEEKVDRIGSSLLDQIDILSETASEFSAIAKSFSEAVTDVDIDRLIREQITLFEGRDNIRLVYDNRTDNPTVAARSRQMARVFLNLMTNSVQAIEDAGIAEGRIRITLSARERDGRRCWRLDFEDNGPGVSSCNVDKLFTPEFTTKTGGSGLGLAISRNIIEQTGGEISYSRSERLGGACFTILLFA